MDSILWILGVSSLLLIAGTAATIYNWTIKKSKNEKPEKNIL